MDDEALTVMTDQTITFTPACERKPEDTAFRLVTSLGVTVIEIRENGDAYVRGERVESAPELLAAMREFFGNVAKGVD